MNYSKLTMLAFLLPVIANAQELQVGKPITANVLIQDKIKNQVIRKPVELMNFNLSEEQLQAFYNTDSLPAGVTMAAPKLQDKVQLGMNDVPVLDQGRHGTCATFSNTAAIDALLQKGDYVSQLCSLELGAYLARSGVYPSGWDGSIGPLILTQLTAFGVVSTAVQQSQGCAGVTVYPPEETSIGNMMSVFEYHHKAEGIRSRITWARVLKTNKRLAWSTKADADAALDNLKSALAVEGGKDSTRVTLGFQIPVQYCSVGACGSYHQQYDTWTLTAKIANDRRPRLGGHEVVVTGYDDNAVVTDDEGTKHTGILTIRNSWGTKAGDNGDYYMTYDYFKKFVMEMQRVYLK